MANREALSVLDEYEKQGLDKELFRNKLHHLGGSFAGFNSFEPLQCNQLLLDRLKFILNEIRNGALADPSSLKRLIGRSFVEVPCSRYASCKGHKFDPNCKHRK